jgi:hypothetical protein
MSLRTQTPANGSVKRERDDLVVSAGDPVFQVTVVYTTPEGTLRALKAAGALAKNLGARVTLMATEVVPFRLPLEKPAVAVNFLERRQQDLVSRAGLEGEEVSVQIWVCRDQKRPLKEHLAPRSLVLVGGRKRWWSWSERRLDRFLTRLGHHVIYVDISVPCGARMSGKADSVEDLWIESSPL